MASTDAKAMKDWARLRREGRIEDFIRYKDMLMRHPFCIPTTKSHDHAMLRFPPPDATPEALQEAAELRQQDEVMKKTSDELAAAHRAELRAKNKDYRIKTAAVAAKDKPEEEPDEPEEETEGASEEGDDDDPEKPKTRNGFDWQQYGIVRRRREAVEELARKTADDPIDYDRDLKWAYTHMGRHDVKPRLAPSVAAYQLYVLAREDGKGFLVKFTEHQKEKRKETGVGDREKIIDEKDKLAALDKLAKMIEPDVESLIHDTLEMYPEKTARVLRKLGYAKKSTEQEVPNGVAS